NAVAFAPNGKVATAGADGTVRIWDPSTGVQLHKLQQPGKAVGVAFSPDGKSLAATSAGLGGTLVLWDVATGKELWRSWQKMLAGSAVAFSPDGKVVVAGFADALFAFQSSSGRALFASKAARAGTT